LENHIPKEQIFIAGNFPLQKVIAEMRQHLVHQNQLKDKIFQENIKNPNWKGKLTKSGRIYYGEEITDNEILKIKEKIKDKGFPTTYYLDGIKSDKSALDVPPNELERIEFYEFRYRKFDKNGKFTHTTPWNFEVKVKRKGKQLPLKKETIIDTPEEIYIILTEEASLEEIKEVQNELLELGAKLSLINIQYNEAKTKIEYITVLFEIDGNSGTVSWQKGNTYKFLVLGRKPGNTFFSGQGSSYLQEIKTRKKDSKLFILGKENNLATIDFLQKQVNINQQLFLKKNKELVTDPNWKGYKSTNSQTYINLTPKMIRELKAKIKQVQAAKTNYYVDGIEWGAEALDIPVEKIAEIRWYEKNLTKYDETGAVSKNSIEQLNIFVSRKANAEKFTLKEGYQYFKACDCTVPKTFAPNGASKFKIEGQNISESNSFQVYDRWGEKVFDATPYYNDWDATSLKNATYYFTFQAAEGEEVAQGYFKIVDENHDKISSEFIHAPESIHYIITESQSNNILQVNSFIKTSLFMRGEADKKRISSIYLEEQQIKALLIVRKFNNLKEAEPIVELLNSLEDKPSGVQFLSINQKNYREILRLKSLTEYEKFYKEKILK